MVFRTTPQLGPQLEDHSEKFYWDAGIEDVSYRLGNRETGSDGHIYILVQAASDLEAEDAFDIDETTWQTTAGTAFEVPAGIVDGVTTGEYFHARKIAL